MLLRIQSYTLHTEKEISFKTSFVRSKYWYMHSRYMYKANNFVEQNPLTFPERLTIDGSYRTNTRDIFVGLWRYPLLYHEALLQTEYVVLSTHDR